MDNDYQRILAAVRDKVAANKQQMSPSYPAGGPPDVYLLGGEHVVGPVLDSTDEMFVTCGSIALVGNSARIARTLCRHRGLSAIIRGARYVSLRRSARLAPAHGRADAAVRPSVYDTAAE